MSDPPKKDISNEEVEVLAEQAKDPESGGEYDDVVKGVDEDPYPMRTFKLTIPFLKDPISFNPAVTIIGLVPLWGLTIYCMVDPTMAKGTLSTWFSDVIDAFTWFYIGKLLYDFGTASTSFQHSTIDFLRFFFELLRSSICSCQSCPYLLHRVGSLPLRTHQAW